MLGTQSVGYFFGGSTSPGNLSSLDRLTYSSETSAVVPGANLTAARRYMDQQVMQHMDILVVDGCRVIHHEWIRPLIHLKRLNMCLVQT